MGVRPGALALRNTSPDGAKARCTIMRKTPHTRCTTKLCMPKMTTVSHFVPGKAMHNQTVQCTDRPVQPERQTHLALT